MDQHSAFLFIRGQRLQSLQFKAQRMKEQSPTWMQTVRAQNYKRPRMIDVFDSRYFCEQTGVGWHTIRN